MRAARTFSGYTHEGRHPNFYPVQNLITFLFSMSVERDIRFDLIARLCPNTTGAELRSVATEVREIYCFRTLHTDMPRRPACLRFAREERLRLNVISSMQWRRS